MSTEARLRLTILGISFTLPAWMLSSQVSDVERTSGEAGSDSDLFDEEFDDDVLYDHFPRP